MANAIASAVQCFSKKLSPNSVSINLTSACQSSCVYCEMGQRHYQREKPLLNLGDLTWIIDQMKGNRIKELRLGGGEPLLFSDIFRVIEYAHNCDIRCHILTNGFLLHRLTDREIMIINKCNTRISISIDSFNEQLEDFLRGVKCSLELPLKGISILNTNKIPVGIMTVISKYNYENLFDLVVRASQLGTNSVSFAPVSFESNFPDVPPIENKISFNIGPDRLKDLDIQLEKIIDFEKRNKIMTNASTLRTWLPHYIKWISAKQQKPFFENFIKRFWCENISSTITINYYGDILPCLLQKPTRSIKNTGGKNLRDLYLESCRPIASLIKKKDYPKECKSCIHQVHLSQLYSTMKYPISNYHLIPSLLNQVITRLIKKVNIYTT